MILCFQYGHQQHYIFATVMVYVSCLIHTCCAHWDRDDTAMCALEWRFLNASESKTDLVGTKKTGIKGV